MVVRERWAQCSNLSFCCLLDSLDKNEVLTCWHGVFRSDFHLVEAWTIYLSIPFGEVVVVASAAACRIYPFGHREDFFPNGSSGILGACVGSLQKLKQYSFIMSKYLGFIDSYFLSGIFYFYSGFLCSFKSSD